MMIGDDPIVLYVILYYMRDCKLLITIIKSNARTNFEKNHHICFITLRDYMSRSIEVVRLG